ncbi:MAG: glycoside hydrolase family 2, partial [Rikenella sp.]|nr:glycoside hydrolase family 2 [Rikenella sp.]
MKRITSTFLLLAWTITAVFGRVPQLSPRPATVAGVAEPVRSLNGTWSFGTATLPSAPIDVPGEWAMQGFEVGEGETAVYTTRFRMPDDWRGGRIKLRFDGVSSHAAVRVNGRAMGEHEGGMVPFEFDITEAVEAGRENTLAVEVQAQTISDRLSCLSQYAAHTVGGILRKVTLFTLPETYVASTDLTTTLDPSYKHATLHIATDIVRGDGATGGTATVEYTLRDSAGKRVAAVKRSVPATGDGSVSAALTVRNARLWNPESPELYTLTTTLSVDGREVQTNEQRVGMRQVEVEGNRLLVNGRPVKLHGVNRHEVHPLRGRSGTPELCRQDAELFKAGNCNYIRTSHYPPSEEFLDACDELGLFVESESALCWIQHGASPIWNHWDYRDERFLPYMIQANVENIQAGRNHPSIILWSLGNESYWSPLWQSVLDSVRRIDSSRPFSFHDQCWGGYNNGGNRTDLWNFHYPWIGAVAACDTMSRPVLFGEYAHLSCYNRTELATDPGIRAAFGGPLVELYDTIYRHPGCLGGALWSGIDDTFHLPDGRIVGYGPWGPIDGWRRPKPEYTAMKRAYTPFRIVEQRRTTEGIELTVENRYDFIEFDRVRIEAGAVGSTLQPIASRIPARGRGRILIPAPIGEDIYLRVTGPQGYVCAEELFPGDRVTAATNHLSIPWKTNETPAALTITG